MCIRDRNDTAPVIPERKRAAPVVKESNFTIPVSYTHLISTESSIRAAQERSKQEVTGKLKDVACAKINAQTEALISMIGENQVDYRFFIGFKLLVNEQEVTMKQFRREAKTAVSDFLHEVNHKLMGDFVSMSNEEIWRFQKMEKLLESKISRRFKVRRLNKDDFGYLIEHLYGQTGTAYEDYEYYLPKKRFQEETLVKLSLIHI